MKAISDVKNICSRYSIPCDVMLWIVFFLYVLYSVRISCSGRPAFTLRKLMNRILLLVGVARKFRFISLKEQGVRSKVGFHETISDTLPMWIGMLCNTHIEPNATSPSLAHSYQLICGFYPFSSCSGGRCLSRCRRSQQSYSNYQSYQYMRHDIPTMIRRKARRKLQ